MRPAQRLAAVTRALVRGRLLNCLLVAGWLWCARTRDYIAVRRSAWFGGLIPHAANVRCRGRLAWCMEYVPRRRRGDPKPAGDSVVVFDGQFRVRLYRLVGEGRADTFRAALDAAIKDARK